MDNTRVLWHYVALILITALAGAISGFMIPIFAVRGALLGSSLSIGVITINTFSQKEFSANKPPVWKTVLLGIIIAGCFGWVIFEFFSAIFVQDGLKDLMTTGVATPLLVICYSFLMHHAYISRFIVSARPFFKKIEISLIVSFAGGSCGIIRFFLIEWFLKDVKRSDLSMFSILIFPISGAIFALLWAIAVILCDPAWSFERWQKVNSS